LNDPSIRLVFLLHFASTWFMVGLIWFVQIVHYPLFARTGTAEFPVYEQTHSAWTTWVVGPPMLVEGITALLLLWFRPAGISTLAIVIGLGLLGVLWLSTAFLQVPCHELLARGFDPVVHQRLVSTNWIRTLAWSLRGLLVLWMAWAIAE
jgi:hypothetical protein